MKALLQKDLIKIVLYLVGAVLLAAVISPMLFAAGKGFATSLLGSPILEIRFFEDLHDSVHNGPFRRYFNRSVLIAALLLAWPTYRWLRAGGEMTMGLQRDRHRWIHFLGAFVLGTATLLLMGYLYLSWEWYLPRKDPKPIIALITGALASGIVVALLEEFFFRGILTGLVQRSLGKIPTLFFIAGFFALIHFMSPPDSAVLTDDEVTWSSGFWMVGTILKEFTNPVFLFASFVTLFVLGLVLGWARLRTGSLWMSIGLHAGIVFGMKLFLGHGNERGRLTRGDFMPWAGEDITIGLVPLILLAADGLLLFIWLKIWHGSRQAKATPVS